MSVCDQVGSAKVGGSIVARGCARGGMFGSHAMYGLLMRLALMVVGMCAFPGLRRGHPSAGCAGPCVHWDRGGRRRCGERWRGLLIAPWASFAALRPTTTAMQMSLCSSVSVLGECLCCKNVAVCCIRHVAKCTATLDLHQAAW